MNGVVVLGIVMLALTAVSAGIVGFLFVWAARKDGEANDAVQAGASEAAPPPQHAPFGASRPPQRGRRRRRR